MYQVNKWSGVRNVYIIMLMLNRCISHKTIQRSNSQEIVEDWQE